jgi:hypothetical protein
MAYGHRMVLDWLIQRETTLCSLLLYAQTAHTIVSKTYFHYRFLVAAPKASRFLPCVFLKCLRAQLEILIATDHKDCAAELNQISGSLTD